MSLRSSKDLDSTEISSIDLTENKQLEEEGMISLS